MKSEEVDKLTLQEAMDYAVQKIVEQGVQCMTANGDRCLYGDDQGNHCAIGWLFDETDPVLMGSQSGVYELLAEYGEYIPALIHAHASAFTRLQEFHDTKHKHERELHLESLRDWHSIDVSAPHWQQWIDMGAGYD